MKVLYSTISLQGLRLLQELLSSLRLVYSYVFMNASKLCLTSLVIFMCMFTAAYFYVGTTKVVNGNGLRLLDEKGL